jgi:hypothetical protein
MSRRKHVAPSSKWHRHPHPPKKKHRNNSPLNPPRHLTSLTNPLESNEKPNFANGAQNVCLRSWGAKQIPRPTMSYVGVCYSGALRLRVEHNGQFCISPPPSSKACTADRRSHANHADPSRFVGSTPKTFNISICPVTASTACLTLSMATLTDLVNSPILPTFVEMASSTELLLA